MSSSRSLQQSARQRASLPLAAAGFLVAADARIIAPLLPAIARGFHTGVGAAGLAVTGYLAAYALCQLCYGPLGDRFTPLTLIRVSLALFAVGTAVCASAPNLDVLIVFRVLTGIAAAAVIPMGLAYLGDTVSLEHRTRALSIFLATLMAGQALGAVFGGLLAQFVSWRAIFVILGVLAGIVTLILTRSHASSRARAQQADQSIADARPRVRLAILRTGRGLFICLALEAFAVAGGFPFVGAALIEHYHLSYGTTGLLLSLFAGGALLSSRIPLRKPKLRLRLGGILLSLAFALIAVQWNVAVSAIGITILGLGFSFAHSTLQAIATEIAPNQRASALSLFSFTANGLGALGTAAVGAGFADPGPRVVFGLEACILLLFAAVSSRVLAAGTALLEVPSAVETQNVAAS